jgi:hypothetical protein
MADVLPNTAVTVAVSIYVNPDATVAKESWYRQKHHEPQLVSQARRHTST